MRQEFETFRKSTLSEIESLKSEVGRLKKALENTSLNDIRQSRASFSEESHQKDKEERKTKHVGAITQEDAFHTTGGEEQLNN